MEWLVGGYLQIALFVVLPAGAYGAVFQKAGYSPWLGILMLVPVANLIVLIWFACATWPLELGYERAAARETDSSRADSAWELKMSIRKALALEKRGNLAEALAVFESVVADAAGKPLAELAQSHVTRIRVAMGGGAS